MHDKLSNSRCINIGDQVFTRNFITGVTWLLGDIIKKLGLLSYEIGLHNSYEIRRHQDHVTI